MNIIIGALIAWLIAKFGPRVRLVDYPKDRSSHSYPVPKGGAFGVVVAFLTSSLLLKIDVWLWAPAVAIGLIGLLNDWVELLPKLRLFLHILAAVIFLLGLNMEWAAVVGGVAVTGLLIFFIAGSANLCNFMDGIDGLAAIISILAFSLLGYFSSVYRHNDTLTILIFCISGACLGFLPFNFPKAKVFMGDVGSTFLGFLFACLVIYLARDIKDFVLLSSFLFPFYADEVTTMFIRIKNREDLFKAHRRHLYQVLANEGQVPHWQVSLGYGVLQLLVALIALYLHRHGLVSILLMLLLAFSGFVAVSVQVRKKLDPIKTGYSH